MTKAMIWRFRCSLLMVVNRPRRDRWVEDGVVQRARTGLSNGRREGAAVREALSVCVVGSWMLASDESRRSHPVVYITWSMAQGDGSSVYWTLRPHVLIVNPAAFRSKSLPQLHSELCT